MSFVCESYFLTAKAATVAYTKFELKTMDVFFSVKCATRLIPVFISACHCAIRFAKFSFVYIVHMRQRRDLFDDEAPAFDTKFIIKFTLHLTRG